jgi:hypothetical protein
MLIPAVLLILMLPMVASAQTYNRYSERDSNRTERRDVRDSIARLDDASVRLENDLKTREGRRVLGGLFWVRSVDNDSIAEVRDFRRAVADLRRSARGANGIDRSRNEARMVIDRGMRLDRYLRLRTGRTSVDADLADIRSSLHLIADAYGLSVRY